MLLNNAKSFKFFTTWKNVVNKLLIFLPIIGQMIPFLSCINSKLLPKPYYIFLFKSLDEFYREMDLQKQDSLYIKGFMSEKKSHEVNVMASLCDALRRRTTFR